MSSSSVKASKPSRRPPTKSLAKTQKVARKVAQKPSKSARPASAARLLGAAGKKTKVVNTVSAPVQPIVAQEIVLRSHKYQLGEAVYFTSPTFGRAAATGSYTVVKLLPSEGDDYQYRIKSNGEAFERVAKESQLERI